MNIFTEYDVDSTDRRDLITGVLEIGEAVSVTSTDVEITLDYETQVNSVLEATLNYTTTVAETVTLTANFQIPKNTEIIYYINGTKFTYNAPHDLKFIDMDHPVSDPDNIGLVGTLSSHMNAALDTLESGTVITFSTSYTTPPDEGVLTIINNSSYIIEFEKAGTPEQMALANMLGLTTVGTTPGQIGVNETVILPRQAEIFKSFKVDIVAGSAISDVIAALTGTLTATTPGGIGAKQDYVTLASDYNVQLYYDSDPLSATYGKLIWKSLDPNKGNFFSLSLSGAPTLFTDFGIDTDFNLNVLTDDYVTGKQGKSVVVDGVTVLIDAYNNSSTPSGYDLDQLAQAIGDALAASGYGIIAGQVFGGADTTFASPALQKADLKLTNNSKYNITINTSSGTTWSELNGTSDVTLVRNGGSDWTSNDVYYKATFSGTVWGTMANIEDQLDTILTTPGMDFFDYDSSNDVIKMGVGIKPYNIKIVTTNTGGTVLWNTANTPPDNVIRRGGAAKDSIKGSALMPNNFTLDLSTLGASGGGGLTLEQIVNLLTDISSSTNPYADYAKKFAALGLSVSIVYDNLVGGTNNTVGPAGYLVFTNGGSKDVKISQSGGYEYGINGVNALRKLMAAETTVIATGGTANSQTMQTLDALNMMITWLGNSSKGANLSDNEAVRVYEGWDNADILNNGPDSIFNGPTLNGTLLDDFIENFTLAGTGAISTGTGLPAGFAQHFTAADSWIMFTNAAVSGAADLVNITLYDGAYTTAGNQNGVSTLANGGTITYAFEDGSEANLNHINQMVRTSRGGTDVIQHHITFKDIDASVTFQYGERAGAGDLTAWAMDNTGPSSSVAGDSIRAWYSHAYYAGDTTYFFNNGSAPEDVVQSVVVDRQNDINATILFEYKNGVLTASMKGYDRKASSLTSDWIQETYTFLPVGFTTLAGGGPFTLFSGANVISFENLQINTALLTDGDMFVVNIAAAAKLDDANTTPASGSAFESNENISIQGDPENKGVSNWGSSMQYRFANDTINGQDIYLLGYAVKSDGTGYYGGEFLLSDNSSGSAPTGFNSGSTVGVPAGYGDSSAFWIHAEVNDRGQVEPLADATVTSAYIQSLESGVVQRLSEVIKQITYSNYQFGARSDGLIGPLNIEDEETYNPYNASLIFDVLGVSPDVLTLRIQGHIVDLDGNYWYVEEEEYHLNTSHNTARDTSVFPPLNPGDVFNPVIIFQDSPFGGLYFDEFTLGDSSLWTAGDRFTLSLSASGGEFEDDPEEAVDEISLYSDGKGTGEPHRFVFNDGVLDNSTIDLHIYQIANNLYSEDSSHYYEDQVMDGTLTLSFGKFLPEPGAENRVVNNAATFAMTYKTGIDAGVAHYYSRARDIKQFYDANGKFILEDEPEHLILKQGDREISIEIGSGVEMGKLAEYISEQIWLKLLMQYDGRVRGEDDHADADYNPYMMKESDKNDIFQFVHYVPGVSAKESVVGTFLSHSVLPGSDYALKFFGSDDLMKALGFNVIQEAKDDVFRVSVSDAHTGDSVASGVKVAAGENISDIIAPGIELDIDGAIGVKHVVYDEKRGSFVVELRNRFDEIVHLADNAAHLQIGANEGENTVMTLIDMRAAALGIEDIEVRTREDAARSVTRLDGAIAKVSAQRARIGAQINRLEHTINNLTTESTNLTKSKSRIKDADIAKDMMEFTKLNILLQAGASMMAQANQVNINVLTLVQ
jgi:flagellin-like hook-associated protein FlgL